MDFFGFVDLGAVPFAGFPFLVAVPFVEIVFGFEGLVLISSSILTRFCSKK